MRFTPRLDPEVPEPLNFMFWRKLHCAHRFRKNTAYPNWETTTDQIHLDASYCLDRAVLIDHDELFTQQTKE